MTVKTNICRLIAAAISLSVTAYCFGESSLIAYDLGEAMEICDDLPLEMVEGIWVYPEDNVTVMILNDGEDANPNQLSSYVISVVETSDSRLHPGEIIGKLYATAQENTFKIELSTEKKNELLLKPKSCLATLSKDGDTFIIKQQKPPFRGRLNFNFNRLLPGFWKIVSVGINKNNDSGATKPPIGMVKTYPSYDGNGSSKRKVRYL